jgi:hypothetical protein
MKWTARGQGGRVILKIIWRRILRIKWRDPVPGQGGVEDGSPPPWPNDYQKDRKSVTAWLVNVNQQHYRRTSLGLLGP